MKAIYLLLTRISIFCFLSVLAISDNSDAYKLEEVHGTTQDCTICHIMNAKNEAVGLIQPITDLCTGCHPDRIAPSEHINDVTPSMDVNGLPLTDSKMTCVTCHDSHEKKHKAMLRADPKDLCLLCHDF